MKDSNLIEIEDGRFRIGEIKGKKTPCFFMINNFGGGGTNVSRFFIYMPIFKNQSSQLLLNYYYLNTEFEKTPAFNTKILRKLENFNDVRKFIDYARKQMIEHHKCCIGGIKYDSIDWQTLILLDSGSGNIFRDLARNLNEGNFEELLTPKVRDYVKFCEKLKFDMAISFDIAGKYTWKKGENQDDNYNKQLEKYRTSEWNLSLTRLFLENTPEATEVMYYVPIHGCSPTEYLQYLNLIFEIETKQKRKFDGIAVGGLGNLNDDMIYEIVENIRNRMRSLQDNRPIHVLGVGSVQNILPLSLCGADTFDCHSPWRRASEDKLILPLLNSSFEVVAEDSTYWKYVHINDIDKLNCDCEVCEGYNLSELKKLKTGSAEESIYFRILAYKHNVHQQEVLCRLLRSKTDVNTVINKIPASKYKDRIKKKLL